AGLAPEGLSGVSEITGGHHDFGRFAMTARADERDRVRGEPPWSAVRSITESDRIRGAEREEARIVASEASVRGAGVGAGANAEAIEAWDGPLFDRFLHFREAISGGMGEFGEEALRLVPPRSGERV